MKQLNVTLLFTGAIAFCAGIFLLQTTQLAWALVVLGALAAAIGAGLTIKAQLTRQQNREQGSNRTNDPSR